MIGGWIKDRRVTVDGVGGPRARGRVSPIPSTNPDAERMAGEATRALLAMVPLPSRSPCRGCALPLEGRAPQARWCCEACRKRAARAGAGGRPDEGAGEQTAPVPPSLSHRRPGHGRASGDRASAAGARTTEATVP